MIMPEEFIEPMGDILNALVSAPTTKDHLVLTATAVVVSCQDSLQIGPDHQDSPQINLEVYLPIDTNLPQSSSPPLIRLQ